MNLNPSDADVLRSYLLRALDEESVEAIERQLFSEDRVFFRRLCLAEDELIDDYVREELDDEAKAAFEERFLCTSERRDKLAFARALNEYVEDGPKAQQGFQHWWQVRIATPAWSMAAAAALLLIALPGVAWRISAPVVVSAQLTPGVVRDVSGQLERVSIPRDAVLVRLKLALGTAAYGAYRASLYRVTEEEVWSQGSLEPTTTDASRFVTLTLPAELLPPEDYYVRLFGISTDDEPTFVDRFDFRVTGQ